MGSESEWMNPQQNHVEVGKMGREPRQRMGECKSEPPTRLTSSALTA
jgi:hypothetical protein